MLTDLQIQRFKIEPGKTKRHADRDGLVLEVRASGKKVFIFRFQWDKKPQTITLGHYPSLSLSEARNLAAVHRDAINKGMDPRPKAASEPTLINFRTIAEQRYQVYKGTWKPFTQTRHCKSLARDVYPFIADTPIDEITKADLLRIIRPHEEQGHHDVAHRLYARLQSIFGSQQGINKDETQKIYIKLVCFAY